MSRYRIIAPHADSFEYTAETLPELNEEYRRWMAYSMDRLRKLNYEKSLIERATLEFQAALEPYWEAQ